MQQSTVLDISFIKLSDKEATAISDCLRVNDILQELNLSNNEITSEGATRIAEVMNVNTVLQKLDLSNNWIDVEGLICLLQTTNSNSALQFLSITHNNVAQSEFLQIEQSVKQMFHHLHQSLCEVHASWNEIVSINGNVKLKSVIVVFYSLNNVTIEDVWSFDTISDSTYRAKFLSNCLKEDNRLQELHFCNHKINTIGLKMLTDAIQINTTLMILDISCNSLSDEGAAVISECLKVDNTLKELNISNNEINNVGASKVAEAMQSNASLTKLDISNNTLSIEGASAISDCLKNNKTLQELNISSAVLASNNRASDEEEFSPSNTLQYDIINIFHVNKLDISNNTICSAVISNCIKNNEFLQDLNISENQITSDGARSIAEAIAVNSKLRRLDISKNYITSEGLLCLLKINNSVLRFLNITYNNVVFCELKHISDFIQTLPFPPEVYASYNKLGLSTGNLIAVTSLCSINSDGTVSAFKNDTWSFDKIPSSVYRAEFFSNCLKKILLLQGHDMHFIETKKVVLFKAMQINTVLDISFIKLSDKEATAISDCLRVNDILQELNLSNNEITSEVATRIAEAMNVNTVLQKLDLSNNWIDVEGLICLLQTTNSNSALQFLSITHNNVAQSEFLQIEQSVKQMFHHLHQSLCEVHASWNEIVSINGNVKLKSVITVFYSLNNVTREDVWSFDTISDSMYRSKFLSNCLKEDNKLQELDLRNHNIDVLMIAKAIQINATLVKLDISFNTLSDKGSTTISECLKVNNILQELNLSNNQITSEGATRIADAMNVNTVLQKLDLSNNWFDVKGLIYLLQTVNTNSALQFLSITHNNVVQSEFLQIKQSVKQMFYHLHQSLCEVHASWNEIVSANEGVKLKSVIVVFYSNEMLSNDDAREDVWSFDTISDSKYRAKFLSNCLKEDNRLQELELCNHNINVVMLANAVQINTTLLKLNISCNTLSDEGIAAISECLKVNNILKELNISKNEISSEGAMTIAEALQLNTALVKLDISRNMLSDKGALSITACLKINCILQELNMSQNKITSNGAMRIAEAIRLNATLMKLDISCNKLLDEGAAAISDSLKINDVILELNISDNEITNVGAKKIAEALQSNASLTKLDISSNTLSIKGASAISDSLKYNRTLQELNISSAVLASNNRASDEEIFINFSPSNTLQYDIINIFHVNKLDISNNAVCSAVISSCIKNNKFLQDLNISENQITSDGARSIADAIAVNSKLRRLDISKNYITSEGLLCLLKINNSVLQFLNITYNNVTASELKHILYFIQTLPFPPEVYASYNKLGFSEGNLITLTLSCSINSDGTVSAFKKDTWTFHKISSSVYRAEFFSNCLKKILLLQGHDMHFIKTKKVVLVKAMQINTVLDISFIKLSDKEATAISDCLRVNDILQELNLSNNEITSEGATRIAEAMNVNTVLQKLDISNNWIDVEGLICLLQTANSNSALQFLSITHNNVAQSEFLQIKQSVKQMFHHLHQSLCEVHASWNEIVSTNEGVKLKSVIVVYSNKMLSDDDTREDVWSFDTISDSTYRAKFLSNCLKEDNRLQELDLCDHS